MSEVLREEFMQPLGLSAYRVAERILLWFLYHGFKKFLNDKRKITADTDLRLCKYFGMSRKGFS